MTGLLHEREFSRKSFVKGGGALIVGFSLAGSALAGRAQAAGSPVVASNAPFSPQAVDSYLVVHADNTVSLMSGYAEAGTGTSTGFLMIAAEELGLDLSQLKSIDPDTNVTPYTSVGSSSGIRVAGPLVRAAAAYGSQALLGLASSNLGVPLASLSVASGVVSGGGKSVSYGELLGGQLFNVEMATPTLQAGQTPAKPTSQYTVVGTRVPRIDIPAKVIGTFVYAQSIMLPGMLHGRVVRPRGQRAYGAGAPIVSIDESSIKHLPDVQIVRKQDFLGVVAAEEFVAIQAAAELKVTWADPPPVLSGDGEQYTRLRELDSAGADTTAAYIQNTGVPNVDVALAGAAKVLAATYEYPYQGHMPLGPYCAVADVTANGAECWSYSQSLFGDRTTVAQALGMPANQVHLIFAGGASGFSAPFEQPTVAAALMSQAVGKPVRVQFMRWDDHGWDFYGQAMVMDVSAGIDANGNMVAFNSTAFNQQNAYIDPNIALAGINNNYQSGASLSYLGLAGAASDGTGNRGVDGKYGVNPNSPGVPNRILVKTTPAVNNGLQVGAVEGPGHPQTLFAWEQMVDELAHAANMDPMQFRLQNARQMPWSQTSPASPSITINGTSVPSLVAIAGQTTHARLTNILNTLAQISNWQPKVPASKLESGNLVTGRGIALSSHAPDAWGAAVADVQVNKKTGKIVVKHMYGVQDSGLTINPGELEDLMSGGMVHGASRALHEEVTYTKTNVTSLDWVTYPILRFADAPTTTTVALTNPALYTPKGGGEEVHDNAMAAIANAFFDATGVRIRQAPMTPGRVRAVLKAAGVA